jgi:hypothetical protein
VGQFIKDQTLHSEFSVVPRLIPSLTINWIVFRTRSLFHSPCLPVSCTRMDEPLPPIRRVRRHRRRTGQDASTAAKPVPRATNTKPAVVTANQPSSTNQAKATSSGPPSAITSSSSTPNPVSQRAAPAPAPTGAPGPCPPNRNPSSSSAPLTAAALRQHNKRFLELRQFGCLKCYRTWWKNVDAYKPVSRCGRCRIRYDAIPVADEHGYGTFDCSCGHQWTNRKSKGMLQQDCKKCGARVTASRIGPAPRTGARKTRSKHSCDGCKTGACRFIFVASNPHQSSGSTVSTSLSVRTVASFNGVEPKDEADVSNLANALRRLAVH